MPFSDELGRRAGWWLGAGVGLTNPPLQDATFDLVRACVAATDTSPRPSAPVSPSPSASGGPSLPVTGTNIWLLTGGGAALIAVGAVLFMAYRRRQSVKFVA
ncbi:LPXTG cell wall anchor domain-containing protein [Dactylosporangium sp. NPDC049742]|uniref:LPXTG cell wall anchor domain-containing protein n=1 Tax=Dactylosporangium sp. NPDC049742 TaxID=3154737 RepID=UPI00342C713A